MKKLTLCVCRIDHKCLSSDGEWDRTYDTSYEWVIEDEEGLEIAGMGGYPTYDKARDAGELAWIKMEEKHD